MTSLTMYSEWTAPTMLASLWTEPTTKRTKTIRHMSAWVKVIDGAAVALCPLVVSAGAIFAAQTWPVPGDPVGSSITNPAPAVQLPASLDVSPNP